MKNYIKDFIQFKKINEAVASEDLLTKDTVAQEIMGTTPAEIAAAVKKFEVKDSKGKSLGTPSRIFRDSKDDIYLIFSNKPQLFEYAEKISVSYNGKPLRLTSKLVEEKYKINGNVKTKCKCRFAYQPKGLPSPISIAVIFKGSKMETSMQSDGGGTGY
jgi:hypothetical protein